MSRQLIGASTPSPSPRSGCSRTKRSATDRPSEPGRSRRSMTSNGSPRAGSIGTTRDDDAPRSETSHTMSSRTRTTLARNASPPGAGTRIGAAEDRGRFIGGAEPGTVQLRPTTQERSPTNRLATHSTTTGSTPAKASGTDQDGQAAYDTPDPIHTFLPITRLCPPKRQNPRLHRGFLSVAGAGLEPATSRL